MTTWPPGTDLVVFDTIDSTNEEARRRTDAGEVGPLWIASKEQTLGRGRQGRTWHSKPGNLAATYLLPFKGSPSEAAKLSFLTSIAVAEVLDALAPNAETTLKWPNDALINGKKVSGILLENFGTGRGGALRLAIGIGLNLIDHPPTQDANWPPTSVLVETGKPPDFDAALVCLAARLHHWITALQHDGFAVVRAAWLERAINLNKEILVRLPNEELNGVFKGLDQSGALMLEIAGEVRHISAGDVFFPGGV